MAAPFLVLLLLAASAGGAFVGGNDGATLPHLQLRGTADSGREHASDASGGAVGGTDGASLPQLELRGIEGRGRGHASDAQPQGLMDYLKITHGCASFAALVARTANAGEIFREHVVAGTGGGLTVFCPDEMAVASFAPKFGGLSAEEQTTVVLHHFAAARYGREQLAAFEWAAVRTLATDASTNKTLFLTVRDEAGTVWLWPSPPSRGSRATSKVTMDASSESDGSLIAVYVVDAVLLPCRLRQVLGDGDEAAACSPCGAGGYLWWLHCSIRVWEGMCMAVSGMAGALFGVLIAEYYCSHRKMM